MRILITDGDNRAALAITRSLGGQHELTVGAREQRSLASVSRYCHDAFAYPDPACHPQAFPDCLATAVHRHQIEVLLPVADITTTPHDSYWPDWLARSAPWPIAPILPSRQSSRTAHPIERPGWPRQVSES